MLGKKTTKNGLSPFPSPSAPPSCEARVVEPFQIAIDATEVHPVDSDPLIQRANNRTGHRSVIPQAGKKESLELNRRIAQSRLDGQEIVREDRMNAVYSENKGRLESSQAIQKIKYSNSDNVDELGASLSDMVPIVVAEQGYTICSAPAEQEKILAFEAANSAASAAAKGGYQTQEYKSIYDTEGGYKMSEYKSIYD